MFQLFQSDDHGLKFFEAGKITPDKQAIHSEDTAHMLTLDLKKTLISMTHSLFGKGSLIQHSLVGNPVRVVFP